MSSELLIHSACQLLEREWRRQNVCQAELPSTRLVRDLVEMVAANPGRPASELETVIQRMLLENHFVDDTGDSMVLDAGGSVDVQARVLAAVLEEVRRQALRSGVWSAEPVTPMMFG